MGFTLREREQQFGGASSLGACIGEATGTIECTGGYTEPGQINCTDTLTRKKSQYTHIELDTIGITES